MSNETNPAEIDYPWREAMLAEIASGDVLRANDALLSLAYYEGELQWVESKMLEVIDSDLDLQVRQLAVICLGHIARIHGAITKDVVLPKLTALLSDQNYASRARNALDDIEIFVK